MTAIFKREFSAYFISPLGYVFLAVFYGFSGLFLWLNCLSVGQADMSGVFVFLFFVMVVLIPVLTMRTMADDKRQKTDQLTLTGPVSLLGLVAGKFLAAFSVFMLASAALPIYAAFISTSLDKSVSFPWVSFWGNYTGIVLMGAVFIAAGIFISNLTESQMIAAVGGIGANIALCLFDLAANYIQVDAIQNVLAKLSVFSRYLEFTLGIFSLENIVFFISLVVVFLFLTIRFIERRRWS